MIPFVPLDVRLERATTKGKLLCSDCGVPVTDWYMVLDTTWSKAWPDYREVRYILAKQFKLSNPSAKARRMFCIHLCLSCLGARLERKLTASDFNFNIPCNWELRERFLGPDPTWVPDLSKTNLGKRVTVQILIPANWAITR
jgi:hypothetical protein